MMYNPYLYPQPQIQQQNNSSGIISVRSMEEAQNYPVAPGNSVTFRDETLPYIYTKTMGYSQLDRPTFEKYRLVKEEIEIKSNAVPSVARSDIERLQSQIDEIKAELGLEDKRDEQHI